MTETKGIVGEKLGMTQIFVETRAVPVTVIKAGPCAVTQIRDQATDGYDAVQLAYGQLRPRDVTKPGRATSTRRGRRRPGTSWSYGPTTPGPTSSARRSGPTCSRPATWSTWWASPRARGPAA